jgi:hypothetical protein
MDIRRPDGVADQLDDLEVGSGDDEAGDGVGTHALRQCKGVRAAARAACQY